MTEVSPEPTSRQELLKRIFLEFSGDAPLSPEAQAYADDGNGLRNALAEIAYLKEPSELDTAIATTRDAYMNVATTPPNIRSRLARKQKLRETEADYKTAVINKLAAYTTTDGSPEAALDLGQLPGIIRKAAFNENPLAIRDLAANHLHLTMDTLLQEHADRRKIIDERHKNSPLGRIQDNRVLHLSVAAVVFVAAFAPDIAPIPHADDVLVSDVTLGLKIATAFVFSVDTPEVIRLAYLDFIHNRQTKKLNTELAADKEATDLALRIVYGSPHYGSSHGFLAHSARFGTDDPHENAILLDATDAQIDGMHGDPGGRPYTGRQAVGYAARFLLERRDQLEKIREETDPAQREKLFLNLAQEILQEDLDRMKKGLTVTRIRKTVMKAIAVAVSPFLANDLNAVNDALSTSHDISSYTTDKPEKGDDEQS